MNTKVAVAPTPFNYDVHVKELIERFGRLIKQLGPNNKKDWHAKPPVASTRYEFEVDFCYALNEIKNSPPYLQGKMFDQASSVVSNLIAHIKQQKDEAEAAVKVEAA